MSNPSHKRTRGKRAGAAVRSRDLKDIHSTIDGLPSASHRGFAHALGSTSQAAAISGKAKYNAHSRIAESAKDFVIPRQSLSQKQLLGILPPKLEMEQIPGRQLDHKRAKGIKRIVLPANATPEQIRKAMDQLDGCMVEFTNDRLVWASDKTLLETSKPTASIGTFKREGYRYEGLNKQRQRTTERENTVIVYGGVAHETSGADLPEAVALDPEDDPFA